MEEKTIKTVKTIKEDSEVPPIPKKMYSEEELEKRQETIGRTTKLENSLVVVKKTITDLQIAVLAMYAGSAVFCYKNFNEQQYIWGILTLISTFWLGSISKNMSKDEKRSLTETFLGRFNRK